MQTELTFADISRFWEKIAIDPATRCWNWDSHYTSDKGDGVRQPQFWVGGQKVQARRFSYEFYFGPCPNKVGTSCGNDRCVNPQHLLPKPGKNDVLPRKFSTRERDPVALSPALVHRAMVLRKHGKTTPAIARKLGVNQSALSIVLRIARMCEQGLLTKEVATV